MRDEQAILKQWKEWFETPPNVNSPTIVHSVIDLVEQMPKHAPLPAEPSTEEVKEAVGKMVNSNNVGMDNICGKVLKLV